MKKFLNLGNFYLQKFLKFGIIVMGKQSPHYMKKGYWDMKKMSKSEIYRAYGIEFKADKILSPFGTWIPALMPIGTNTKVGNAATFSQYHGNEVLSSKAFGEKVNAVMALAGVDEIRGSCPCHCKGCYCDKGRYNFDSNKASAILKLLLVRMFPEWVENALIAEIKAEGITQVRIHAQGDFDSDRNCEIWLKVARSCEDTTTFWTYTKNRYALEIFQSVKNIKIVPSITPYGFNFGTCSEILKLHKTLTNDGFRVHICACGTSYEKHCSDCKTGCKAVGETCDFVLFIEHSGAYKAGVKDPDEFKAVCEIIARQDN